MKIEHMKEPAWWYEPGNAFNVNKHVATRYESPDDLPETIEDNDGTTLVYDGEGWYFAEDDEDHEDELAAVIK